MYTSQPNMTLFFRFFDSHAAHAIEFSFQVRINRLRSGEFFSNVHRRLELWEKHGTIFTT